MVINHLDDCRYRGILYLIFQDIAPQSRMKRHWGPPLGAVFGFTLAMFAQMVMTNA